MTGSLQWHEGVDELAGEWTVAAEESGNVFATPEFASIWWRHFGSGGGPPLVAAIRGDEGRLTAIVPLYVWRTRALRVVRFVGHGPGDELGPVVGVRDRAAGALRSALAGLPGGFDLFLGEQLPATAGLAAAVGARTLSREGSPVLALGRSSWEELLAAQSRDFRKQASDTQRRERKLSREYECRFRLADDADRLPEDLDVLFALHAARWGPASAFLEREAFQREFATCAFERGWLRLWFLEIDGVPRAAWLGFRFAGTESHYQGGRDPAWQTGSIGLVLLVHTIREALADGIREYRFLRGGEIYKHRFADSDPGLETIALGRGPLGRAAVVAAPLVRVARRSLVRHR